MSGKKELSREYKELMDIFDRKAIASVFQPVVNLKTGEVFGYEALSRGPAGSMLAGPDKLFAAAESYKCLWKLDYLCRRMAIERIQDKLNNKLLFINVDPKILYDKKFHQGSTLKLLQKWNIDGRNVVFEVSEKTAIVDYEGFSAVLENYRIQGYKIALDDVGSGYSGLTLLANALPNFIKIDIALIREVDKDHVKRAIIKSLIDVARVTRSKIIAEGIEREEELLALIELGVDYGQGFYLGKPSPVIGEIDPAIRRKIELNHRKREVSMINSKLTSCIGEIATKQTTFSAKTFGSKILDYLRGVQDRMDIILVDENKPVGLLSQDVFYSCLATTYGISVYSNRPIELLMDQAPLILDYTDSIEKATRLAMEREANKIYDSLIVVKNQEYYGTVTIKKLLEVTTKIELNRARYANPLTGLPGNVMIDWELKQYLADLTPFFAIYIDLDNFKVYNDLYGFEDGDMALMETARILQQCMAEHYPDGFLGHIGGDDFILLFQGEEAATFCEAVIRQFDEKAATFYSAEHREQKFVMAKNRSGQTEKFPLMSISLAVLHVLSGGFDVKTIAAEAAKVKKYCKKSPHSNFIVQAYNPDRLA